MKILHTADWHVGKTLQGRSRAEEHQAVLDDIARVAVEQDIDLTLVAGDLFDSASPSPEAERIVFSTLMKLSEHAPVVVIPGNHDNDRRLSALTPLFALTNVHVRAGVELEPIEITAHGETALITCIPWLSQRYIVKAAQLMAHDAAETRGLYEERMQLILDVLTKSFRDDTVNVILGHLTLAGGAKGGGEREAQTIFDYWVNPAIFPASAHYVALGHLHKRQTMPAKAPLHYCGSPLQLDFGESTNEPHVLIAEAKPKIPAKVTPVKVSGGRPLVTMRGTLDELKRQAKSVADAYLRVFVRERERVGLGDEVRELFPNAVKVIVEHEEGRKQAERPEMASHTPHELFEMYLAEREVEDPRLVKMFDELLEEAQEASV
jgi:exonuclease SbcD